MKQEEFIRYIGYRNNSIENRIKHTRSGKPNKYEGFGMNGLIKATISQHKNIR